MTWLQRLVHAFVRWCTPLYVPLSEPMRTVLDDALERLSRIEALMSQPNATTVGPAAPAPRIADCGHETVTVFQAVKDGITRCPACHAKRGAA